MYNFGRAIGACFILFLENTLHARQLLINPTCRELHYPEETDTFKAPLDGQTMTQDWHGWNKDLIATLKRKLDVLGDYSPLTAMGVDGFLGALL